MQNTRARYGVVLTYLLLRQCPCPPAEGLEVSRGFLEGGHRLMPRLVFHGAFADLRGRPDSPKGTTPASLHTAGVLAKRSITLCLKRDMQSSPKASVTPLPQVMQITLVSASESMRHSGAKARPHYFPTKAFMCL